MSRHTINYNRTTLFTTWKKIPRENCNCTWRRARLTGSRGEYLTDKIRTKSHDDPPFKRGPLWIFALLISTILDANLHRRDRTWSLVAEQWRRDGANKTRGKERRKERNWRKKSMVRKDAGTLRRYFQFDLRSKPLMPAYSLAWKRIPKRYLNFPNAPRKRAKRRTVLLPLHFFFSLIKSWGSVAADH